MLKHAGATRAEIALTGTGGVLELAVRDDGAGLPPAVVAAGGPVSLRDRVEAVGGTVRSAVTPGGGTIVRARLPAHGCPGMAGRFFDGGAGR